ncbi:autotransporter domain-containing protein [Desulfovibrio sp.]
MQLTKGAIGNLINRYKAVLKKCHLLNVFGSLAVAGMLVMGGAATAGAVIQHTSGVHDYTGENLSYTASGDAITANGTDTRNNPQINIGNNDTQSITINAGGGIFSWKSGHITLTSKEVSLISTDTSGSYSALWAQNNSTDKDGIPADERASIIINAENTNIKAANSAIVAMSNGIIEINGNLHIEAQNALLARGDAIISLNKSGESTVGIDGNINFNYDGPTSGTGVNATIDITLNGADSYWNGNTLISWNGTPSDESKLTVSEMTLIVKDGATWTPTVIENTADQRYASLNNLILENGNINVNEGVEIAIDKVSGTGILDNKGTVTLTSGALDGRSNNSGVINIDPGASASNVTFEKGELTPSKALIAVEAERTTLNGGMATGDDASASVAGVAMDADKNVKIEGVAFTGNTFTVDRNYPIIGAVTANLSDTQRLTITGSTFKKQSVTLNGTGSSGSSGGAAVSVKGQGKGSTLTITDSTFSGNQYNDTDNAANGAYGGAIGVQNASVTLTNVTLSGNSGDSGNQVQGGGYYQSIGSLNATQLKVSENKVETSSNLMGAGMVLWGTSGSISDSEFTGNTGEVDAWALGGGLYLRGSRWGGESDLSFSISDTTFSGNSLASKTDDAQGGGLYVKGDASNGTADGNGKISVQLDNVTFTDNTVSTASAGAASQGGALYILGVDDNGGSVPDNATVTVNNGTFTGNTAKGGRSQGGAIYNEGTLTVEGGSFTNNSAAAADGNEIAASNVGGAIYNADNAKLSINGTRFEGNTAAIAGAVNNQYDSSYITAITDAVFVNNTASLSAGGALRNQGIIDSIAGTTFEGNTAGNGGALWNGAGGTITSITDTTFTGNKSTNAVVGGGAITNAGVIKAINATTFTGNTAAGNGGAIYNVVSGGGQASIALSNTTFTDNTAGKLGGAIYNDGSLSFTGNNTFSGNMAAGQANDIYNADSIIVADGTTTLGSGLTQVGGNITVNGGTLDMASGSSLSFDEHSTLTIKGGTFVADFGQLLTDYATTNTANGITDESIIGTSGNLNLRLNGGYYTLEQYNAAKGALLGQADVPEDATLNFLNANLQLEDDQALVVGAKVTDDNVTITMAPVVADAGEAPKDAIADGTIPSVPNQIVSVVDVHDTDKELLSTDSITVAGGSEFTAKGLQIDGTEGAAAVTLAVTDGSKVTLTGGEAGFTGVVNAEGDAVATNVEVKNDAALTVGLEGNENAQNLVLNEVTVADGTFAVAGNGLETTQVAANTLEVVNANGSVAVDKASLTVENAVVADGLLSITNAVADLGTVEATGGVLFFDPSYGTIKSLANNELGSKLLVSDGSVVNVAFNLEDLQEMARKAGFTTTPIASDKFTLGAGQSMLAVGQPIQLIPGGQIVVDANVDATGAIGGSPVPEAAYFGADSLLVVNGNTLNGATAAITLDASNSNLNVENGAKLLIADAVAGTTYTIIDGETNTSNAFNGGAYADAGTTGWKGSNLLTSSDMLTLTSTDGTVFMAKSEDAHTVFPKLSHELATAVNTLYGQKLNDVDADAMGVRFLSRATDNRFLGSDKDAAASTIESAARIAFAGAVPQMTKMASDAGSNAVVNRLGFANPADGAQAMNAEGKIVDRNTTGFALWIAPLWQSQHGWGMEADNLDYGFNGNLGGVSLGADYTFENAIRAGITFNIGGGYAESSGGDLNSTENRMSFWGLGAYAGWNYENFGLMADVSYTSTWNDLQQDMDSRMGMGDLEADVQATAISAGLRAEYKLETSALDIIPHIGVRYMSLTTWGYDADTYGGTVLEGDGFHQDIWTFPIGVTFSKDITLDSGWFFKPSVDFSVIPAAGDIKAKQDVSFTGLPGTYEVETQMMDYLTWQGGVGIELGNDTLSFGVNYTLQAGQNTTGHGVFGNFRYEF